MVSVDLVSFYVNGTMWLRPEGQGRVRAITGSSWHAICHLFNCHPEGYVRTCFFPVSVIIRPEGQAQRDNDVCFNVFVASF